MTAQILAKQTDPHGVGLAQHEIESRLTDMLAETLRIAPAEIDVSRPLPHYGLDSIDAVTLAGDLEDWLNVELPSTLLWDYPTVEGIASYLGEALRAQPAQTAHAPQDSQGIDDDLLDHLDDLEPGQIDALLDELIP